MPQGEPLNISSPYTVHTSAAASSDPFPHFRTYIHTLSHPCAGIVPIPVGPGVVLESSAAAGGTRQELLRSLCQITNETNMPLEVWIGVDWCGLVWPWAGGM